MHSKAVHRRARLPNDRRDAQKLLREVGQDRGRRCDERSQDEAVERLRIHLVLAFQYG